jgi:glycine cleavage system H protein
MSEIKNDLKYTAEHEWAKMQDDVATVGITDFAQSSLGDVVFVELPEVGRHLSSGDSFGVVESIKSVSDLYAPLSGTIIAINDDAVSSPESLNQSPYDTWLVKIRLSQPSEVDLLLSAESYKKHCEGH